MHECERRHHRRILQIGKVLADLIGEQHAFVDNGAR